MVSQVSYKAINLVSSDSSVTITELFNGDTDLQTSGGGGGSPGAPTTSVQYNNSGAFAGNANFTYDAGTNTVTFGNITGSALGMTIQPKAPLVTEDAGLLSILGRNAVKANSNGSNVVIRSGGKTGTGAVGSISLALATTGVGINLAQSQVDLIGFDGSSFLFSPGGFLEFRAGNTDFAQLNFVAGVNTAVTGNVPISFKTDTGPVIQVGESTFGSQELGFFAATPAVQQTTATASATRSAVIGTFANVGDTYDGYTLSQVVKALRNYGLLA